MHVQTHHRGGRNIYTYISAAIRNEEGKQSSTLTSKSVELLLGNSEHRIDKGKCRVNSADPIRSEMAVGATDQEL